MTKVALEKAKQDLPALIERVLAGEEIVIEADGQLIRLAPMPEPVFDEANARRRGYGMLKGKFELPDTFFEPLS